MSMTTSKLIYDIKPTVEKLELVNVNGVLMWNNANIEKNRTIDLRTSERIKKYTDHSVRYKPVDITKGFERTYIK